MNKNNNGVTLVELLVTLFLIGILISGYLSLELIYVRTNNKSTQYLNAGSIASNLYEVAKGMSIPELSNWLSAGEFHYNNFFFTVEAERVLPEPIKEGYDIIDLVVTSNKNPQFHFLCFGIGEHIYEIPAFSGNGTLLVQLSHYDDKIMFDLSDSNDEHLQYSYILSKEKLIINLHSIDMKLEQNIILNIEKNSFNHCEVHIYESPLQNSSIKVCINQITINTKDTWQPIEENNLYIFSKKTGISNGIPFSILIYGYKNNSTDIWANSPIARRQGIFIARFQ
ncbi:MAG: type IV pilus modification PilV family protein [Caldicoprobacterales bacterium]|jgi:prepilin-type N-terminal cleavage/methylation domain-containing protein